MFQMPLSAEQCQPEITCQIQDFDMFKCTCSPTAGIQDNIFH